MIAQDLISAEAPEAIQQAAQWRCMDGNLWFCVVGANLPCGEKADRSDAPTQAMGEDFCQAMPGLRRFRPRDRTSDGLFVAVRDETPTVIEELFTADAQGYLAEFLDRAEALMS